MLHITHQPLIQRKWLQMKYNERFMIPNHAIEDLLNLPILNVQTHFYLLKSIIFVKLLN